MSPAAHRAPQDAVELELIRSLSAALLPSSIMTVGFAMAGGLIVLADRDATLLWLLLGGMVASAARIIAALRMPGWHGSPDFSIDRARRLERDYHISHAAFAAMLGLFSFRAFLVGSPTVHMLMLCLVIGYAAGVAATVALRPRIAIPSMLMAVVPTIIAALFRLDPLYVAVSLMTAAFLIGGIQNLRVRYAHTVEEITLRIAFANIARKDSLTALPNRIALREWFQERCTDSAAGSLIAVHYLDLDGFKPINDRYGHPFGDALLTAVGKRIVSAVRGTDIAARLGGDEFAVVQFGIEGAEDAEHLARRLSASVSRPYNIEDRIVCISTSIGYVVATPATGDLEKLLNQADQALYISKRQGGGITRHEPAQAKKALSAA